MPLVDPGEGDLVDAGEGDVDMPGWVTLSTKRPTKGFRVNLFVQVGQDRIAFPPSLAHVWQTTWPSSQVE